jgi:cobalt-precorrin-5B (C1)-methyltransferase
LGARVFLSVENGEIIAEKTLNSKIGVVGGISILGTTGFVEPWDSCLAASMAEQIAHAQSPVLTTGRTGLRFSRLLYPEHDVILVGSKLSEALSSVCDTAILCGLPGLILRFLCPNIAVNEGFSTVEELMASSRGEEIMRRELDAAKIRYPAIHIVIINREGSIIGETR